MKNEKQATDPTSPRYAISGFHNKRAETGECLLKVYPNPSEGTAIVEGSGKPDGESRQDHLTMTMIAPT